jgi:outer membrane immunogenic protein
MKLSGNLGLRATSFKYISTGVAALSVLAFSAQANAADIYAPVGPAPFPVGVPLAPLWSGLYIGGHVGGAWSELQTTDLNGLWFRDADIQRQIAGGAGLIDNRLAIGPLHTNQSESGVFGGGTIGYNIQRGGLVAGIEADFGAMNLNGNTTLSHAPVFFPGAGGAPTLFPYTETANSSLSTGFYADLTGRLGWAWGPWMFYGKGGLAILEAKTDVSDQIYSRTAGGATTTWFPGATTDNESRVGWTAGAGFEYLWNQAWSVKVEYQFFDFGTESSSQFPFAITTPAGGGAPSTTLDRVYSFNHDLTVNTVKVGINYHLGCCDTPIVPFN